MEFNKYKELGDYHFREYENGTIYRHHIDRVIDWIGTKGNTIDVGSGEGVVVKLINERGGKCIGIDDNPIAVKLAAAHGVKVELMSIYSCACRFTGYFDNVFMGDVIEHLQYPDKAILKVKKILKDGGHFYIATPPALPNGALHDKYHYKEYSPETLKRFIEQSGFKLVEPITIANVRMYAKFKKI